MYNTCRLTICFPSLLITLIIRAVKLSFCLVPMPLGVVTRLLVATVDHGHQPQL